MKKYQVIYCDPPYSFKTWSKNGIDRCAEKHYPTMDIPNICALPVADIADKDSALFIWVTYPLLREVFKIITAWEFSYKTTAFTWVKRCKKSPNWHTGLGYWTRSNAEICLLATKGHPTRVSKSVHQIIDTPIERHSKKPDEVRNRIVQLMGDVPRIELFAREKSNGWDVFGNEVESDIVLVGNRFTENATSGSCNEQQSLITEQGV